MNFVYIIIFTLSFVFSQNDKNKTSDENDSKDNDDKDEKPDKTEKIDYCAINKDHILCGADGDSVLTDIVSDHFPLNDNDRKSVLHLINKERDRVAAGQVKRKSFTFPPAANMFQVEWNKQFENAAFNGMKNCKDEETYRKCCNCMNTGETDLLSIRIKIDVREAYLKNFTDRFNQMLELSNFKNTDKPYTLECIANSTEECMDTDGFFVHLLHDRIVQIGCIFVRCYQFQITVNGVDELHADGFFYCIANLNYYLDIIHHPLYLTGSPRSKCPKGSSNSTEYKNLCKCNKIKECLIPPSALKTECTTRSGEEKPDLPSPVQPTPAVVDIPFPIEIEPVTQPPPPPTTTTTTTKQSDSGGGQDTSGTVIFVCLDNFVLSFAILTIVIIQ